MSGNRQVTELVLHWDELREQGQSISGAELCRDCPEYLPEVERRIGALMAVYRVLDTNPSGGMNGAAGTRLSEPAAPPEAAPASVPLAPTLNRPGEPAAPVQGRADPSPVPVARLLTTADQEPTLETMSPPLAPVRFSVARDLPAVPGYTLLEELGRGGMGVVYKAHQTRLNRLVALKMILAGPHAHSAELERFRTEAEAVARLQHPHIVQIHAVEEANGHPFFSLEYVAGGNLASQANGTPLPARQAAQLVQLLARAMHFAHQRGIIHRDLKPHNILLAPSERPEAIPLGSPVEKAPRYEPKIGDFGLAKRLDSAEGQTQTGAIMGTPNYMAPEQATGKTQEIGPAADVYALGAILYELLTGRPPFKAETALDTLYQVVNEEPVAPTRLVPRVPRDLETICLKCLGKERAKRYATAEALAEDVQRFLTGEPIQARPARAWERLGKWAWRKPVAAALVAVTVLAVFALVAASAFYARSQSQQAGIYKQQLKKVEEEKVLRERIRLLLGEAQQHEVAQHWEAAHTELAKAQEALAAQPDLGADDLRAEVQQRLATVKQRLTAQEQRQAARQRLEGFQALYNKALFYETLFTGGDVAVNRARARTAARQALDLYGLGGKTDPAERLPTRLKLDRDHHSAVEHARLARACYELLLIWAEIEADSPPDQVKPDGPGQRRAKKALALLKRAARLGRVYRLKTRTYYLHRAHYLASSKGEAFEPTAVAPAVLGRPTSTLDWFLQGLQCYRAGRDEEVRLSCAEVLRQEPEHFWARYVLALSHLRAQRWVEAREELTTCINRRRTFVWPRLFRGHAAMELGYKHKEPAEFAAAQADFDQVLMLAPLQRDPLVRYVGLVNRGVLFIRQQRWAEAIRDLRQAKKVAPEFYQADADLAEALKGVGQRAQAVAALDQAIKRAPLAQLYRSRARLQLLLRHPAAAEADLKKAIAQEPKGSKSQQLVNNLVELGRVLHRERKYTAALVFYDQALKRQPEFVLAQRFRAETLLALDRPDEAGQALDRYLAGTKEEVPVGVYQARGLIYASRRQFHAALDMYALALQQNPDDAVTRCCRGWTHLLTGAVQLALEDFEACLRQDATNVDALAGRGNARARLKQLDKALDDARAVEKVEKQVPLTYRQLYNLTRIYAQVVGQLAKVRTAQPDLARRAEQQLARCRDKALDGLRQILEKLPPQRRAAFWHKQVEADPAFTAIRRGSLYLKLAARYDRSGS